MRPMIRCLANTKARSFTSTTGSIVSGRCNVFCGGRSLAAYPKGLRYVRDEAGNKTLFPFLLS